MTDTDLNCFIQKLHSHNPKVSVIRHLDQQVNITLRCGQADVDTFLHDLAAAKLFSMSSDSIAVDGFDTFYAKIKKHAAGRELSIPGLGLFFNADELAGLRAGSWLNVNVILACLHLSERLPWVKIGFSIPTHRDGGALQRRPFEGAATKVRQWRKHSSEPMVFLFILFLRNNHFSLLEINERRKVIYHYDSIMESTGKDDHHEISNTIQVHSWMVLFGALPRLTRARLLVSKNFQLSSSMTRFVSASTQCNKI